MARRRTPSEWQDLMDRAQLASIRRLSEAAGLSHNAVTRVVHGDTVPTDETVTALAAALRVPAKDIYKLTHGHDIQARPWTPPAEVQRLSKREQDALTEMIRAMAAGRDQEEVTGNAEHPAPIGDKAADTHADECLAIDDPNGKARGSTRDHAAQYDLAAHPDTPLAREDFERTHGGAGEESQDDSA